MAKFTAVIGFLAAASIIGLSSAIRLSHSEALRRLQAAGISVSSIGRCSHRRNAQCTSLDQVRDSTINGLINFKQASGCTVVVTGGTETGHGAHGTYSHWNGYKADIRPNTCVNNYITSRFTDNGVRSDGARKYRSSSGDIYAREGNHWDIIYYA